MRRVARARQGPGSIARAQPRAIPGGAGGSGRAPASAGKTGRTSTRSEYETPWISALNEKRAATKQSARTHATHRATKRRRRAARRKALEGAFGFGLGGPLGSRLGPRLAGGRLVGGRLVAGRRSTRILSTVLPMPGYTSRPTRGPYRVPRCGAGLRRGHKRDRNPDDPKLGGCVGAARCDPGWDADRTHIPGGDTKLQRPEGPLLRHAGRGAGGRTGAGLAMTRSSPATGLGARRIL